MKKLGTQGHGVAYLIVAAALCSIGGVCIKFVPWTPLSINGARCAIAACITALAMRKRRHAPVLNASTLRGGLCLALTTVLYVFSTKLTSAAAAVLLMYTAPLWVLLFLWLAHGKKPTASSVLACVGVLSGTALLVADGLALGGTSLLGNALGLGSGMAYAGVFLVNTEPQGDAASSYLLGQVMAAILGMPFLLGERNFSLIPLLCVGLLGVFQLGLSYLFMARGVARTNPTTASLITCLEPLLCPVWVWLLYGETLSALALSGGAIVLAAMIGNQISTRHAFE